MKKASPKVRKVLLDSIQTQLNENNPPETKMAFMRLLGEGISEEDVYIYLAKALTYEIKLFP